MAKGSQVKKPSRPPSGSGPIVKLRQEAGLSQRALAFHAGVPMGAVLALERMGRPAAFVTIGYVIKLADALGCAPLDLVPGLAWSARRHRHQGARIPAHERATTKLRYPVPERPEAFDAPRHEDALRETA